MEHSLGLAAHYLGLGLEALALRVIAIGGVEAAIGVVRLLLRGRASTKPNARSNSMTPTSMGSIGLYYRRRRACGALSQVSGADTAHDSKCRKVHPPGRTMI